MRRIMPVVAAILLAACSVLPPGGNRTPSGVPGELPSPAAGSPTTSPTPGAVVGGVRLCRDVPQISAPEDWYRDQPIYVANEMPTEDVRAWAAGKPGYQEIWIDREHHGWITVGFSQGAATRQAELAEAFPEVGVVAVDMPLSTSELGNVQRRVTELLRPTGINFSSGTRPNYGVVTIDLAVLEPELVALVNENFHGEPVCISGMEPSQAPVEGPQPQAGHGWRLVADQDEHGSAYRTGIAFDAESYANLWAAAELDGDAPTLDFEAEVAIWFGAVHGSSCPRIRLDDVVVQGDLVHSVITYLDLGVCTADAIGHAYVVALERARLPEGPFRIQLEPDPPPGGLSRTIVDVDLAAPGSRASPREVHFQGESNEPYYVEPGGFIEDGFAQDYLQSVKCGIEWLGPLNDTYWRTAEANGASWVPEEWAKAVDDEWLILSVLITANPPSTPTLEATADQHAVTYEATSDQPPDCDH